MATTYSPATAAEEIATRLIAEHHRHLLQARICWLKTSAGQSKARACNALLQHAFGKDASGVYPVFCVVVTDADWYSRKGSGAREALVDTLLCSMTRQNNADTGKDRWAIAKPDVSLYLAVVKRHGLSTTEEQQVGKLIKDLPEQLALVLDSDDEDEGDDVLAEGDDEDRLDWTGDPATVGPPDSTWEDVPRPDVSPEAISRIRGSVEAGALS